MRKAIVEKMRNFLMKFKHSFNDKPIKMGFVGWVALGGKVVGTALLGAALAFPILPFTIGALWPNTMVLMGVVLLLSSMFFQLGDLLAEALATLHLLRMWWKKVNLKEYIGFREEV